LKPEPTPEPEVQTAENQKIKNGTDGSQAASTPVGASDLSRPPASAGEPGSEPSKQIPESVVPIRKAIPVQPQDKGPAEIRRALPVKPLDQESAEEKLLKYATPAPSDLDE
jgi:hypothetical protein